MITSISLVQETDEVVSEGEMTVGEHFRQLPHAWVSGTGGLARDDVGVILDEVILGGRESQGRLALSSRRSTGRVGGLCACDLEVAVSPEVARPERTQGMNDGRQARDSDRIPVNGVVVLTVTQTPDVMWTLALRNRLGEVRSGYRQRPHRRSRGQ